MARPKYHSQKDTIAEEKLAKIIKQKWFNEANAVDYLMTPDFSTADVLFYLNGQQWLWGEFKIRTDGPYPTYLISLEKILRLRNLSKETGLPTHLFVQWDDLLWSINVNIIDASTCEIHTGGRTDRRDKKDTELCYFIPRKLFDETRI